VEGDTNETVDAIGPETFRYRGLAEMIAREIGSRALIVSMPPWLAFQGVRVLGWMVGDVINTRDEVKGLMAIKSLSVRKKSQTLAWVSSVQPTKRST
jgi:hypothetical protein